MSNPLTTIFSTAPQIHQTKPTMKQRLKNKLAAIYDLTGLSQIHLTLAPLRQKLFSSTDQISTLLELCYSLARISPGWSSSSSSGFLHEKHFHQSPIKLRIKTLGDKAVKLMLPASAPRSAGPYVREGYQLGDGYNFNSFVSMLPESCRDISQKASPLGLVAMLFPYGKTEENMRYVACCFWIWLCVIDGKQFLPHHVRKMRSFNLTPRLVYYI